MVLRVAREGRRSMRKLSAFSSISVDGYFRTLDGDGGWMHQRDDDAEFKQFVEGNAAGGGVLVFGRRTYEMMVAWWPTPAAAEQAPAVARRMNSLPKIVFSRTLREASWSNTTLVKDDPVEELRKRKNEPGDHMVILGSGTIVSLLAQAGLVDEYQLVVVPVVLGKGKTLFEGAEKMLNLTLKTTRSFDDGRVLLVYQPRARGSS